MIDGENKEFWGQIYRRRLISRNALNLWGEMAGVNTRQAPTAARRWGLVAAWRMVARLAARAMAGGHAATG